MAALCVLTLSTSLVRDAQASVRGTQCAAEDKAKRSKKALDYALGLYTAAAALCGTACYAPTTVGFTGPACTASTYGALGYDVYQAIALSKDPSGLLGLVFGIQSGGVTAGVGTTIEILGGEGAGAQALPATQPARGSVPDDLNPNLQANEANADKAKEQSKAYCSAALMDALQAVMKLMASASAKNAAKTAKDECEAQPVGATQLTLGSRVSTGGSDATATITPLGNPGAPSNQRATAAGADECGQGIPRDLKTFQNCATAADPSLSKFFTPEFKQDFQNVMGTDLGTFARAQGEGGFADRLTNGLAAVGKKGPDTEEGAKALEALITNEIQKSSGSQYAGGGGGSRRGGGADDKLNPKKLIKDIMSALTGNKDEEEKKRQANALVFGATREPANDLSSRRDVSLFERVARRYRESFAPSVDRVTP